MSQDLLGLAALHPVEAAAFELTGAWASQADLCKLVFVKNGKQVVFAEMSNLFRSGFIVDGSRIRGASAQCTIKSRKQEGDGLELDAAWATSIMNQNVHFSLKIIDDNNVSRSFPGDPGNVAQILAMFDLAERACGLPYRLIRVNIPKLIALRSSSRMPPRIGKPNRASGGSNESPESDVRLYGRAEIDFSDL